MKRKEFKFLLELLDKERIIDSDWNAFTNQDEARINYSYLRSLRKDASYDDTGFNPWFRERVMGKINGIVNMAGSQSLDEVLSSLMSKVMVAGTLTILVFLLLLFAYHGQVGVDTLTGIEQDSEINFVSSLFNEY